MTCNRCGSEKNETNSKFCSECGAPVGGGFSCQGQPAVPSGVFYRNGHPYVPNNLILAILTTLFCCLPLGIVSIVFAAQVDSKFAAGDIKGAMESSRRAKTWGLWALGAGILINLITVLCYALYVVMIVGASAMQCNFS